MASDVLLIPLIAAAACALPIGGFARALAILAGLLTTLTVGATVWLGIGSSPMGTFAWAAPIGAQLSIGADGWSAVLLALSGVLFAIGAGAVSDVPSPRAYFALWSLLQLTVAGVLVARDLILFFAFWEALVVPLALLMWLWGGVDRRAVTMRLVLVWMTGGALLFTGIIALGVGARTFSLADLSGYRLAESSQVILALLFLAAFATRLPLFPLHAWQARAYVSAPVPVALVLGGVISPLSIYAIARICGPLFPRGLADLAPALIALASVGALYGAILATRQRDTRALAAFVGLSQLDLVALGVFLGTPDGLAGALVSSASHGLVVAALLLLCAALARRMGSFDLAGRGIRPRAPVLMALLVVAILAALGLPGTSGAPGQLLILAAAYVRSPGVGLLATLAVVAAAGYAIVFLRATAIGGGAGVRSDLTRRERALIVPLIVLIVALGIAPRAITDLTEPSAPALTERAR